MAYLYNIDTKHLDNRHEYYPFHFLSVDDKINRLKYLYNKIYHLYDSTGDMRLYFVLKDALLIDYLLAQGMKSYNIGNGNMVVKLNPPAGTSKPYFLVSFNVYFDLEHPLPLVINVLVIEQ